MLSRLAIREEESCARAPLHSGTDSVSANSTGRTSKGLLGNGMPDIPVPGKDCKGYRSRSHGAEGTMQEPENNKLRIHKSV